MMIVSLLLLPVTIAVTVAVSQEGSSYAVLRFFLAAFGA